MQGGERADDPHDPAADFLAVARQKAQAVAAETAFEGAAEPKKGAKGRKAKKAKATKVAGDDAPQSALARFRKPMLLAAAVAIAAALVLPDVVSTVGGVTGGSPVVAELADEGDAVQTFGEVEPFEPVAAESPFDAVPDQTATDEATDEAVAGGVEGGVEGPIETASLDDGGRDGDRDGGRDGRRDGGRDGAVDGVSAMMTDAVPGTDAMTTRSIDPVDAGTDAEADPVEATSGPVEGLEFTDADGSPALVAAAETGDARALHEIAGRTQDATRALALYRAAAERGLAPSQYRLGQAYEKGRGTPVDYAKAKSWYARAAEAGNTSAMHNLAVLYAMGAEGEADPVLAGRWFTEAANLGVKDSQYNLGILHAQGTGVEEDLTESYKWFDAASNSGDPEAGGKRDEVAGAMAPGELETARTKAGAFRAQAPDIAANRVTVPDDWRAAPALDAADMKRAVRNVQAILNKNGFDAGTADGVMGKKTRQAILQFQEAAGLAKTGQIDDALVKALLERNT